MRMVGRIFDALVHGPDGRHDEDAQSKNQKCGHAHADDGDDGYDDIGGAREDGSDRFDRYGDHDAH